MSCRLLRTRHRRHLLLKTLRPRLIGLLRHLLGPGAVLRLGNLLIRLRISLRVLLRIRLGVPLLRHVLGGIPLRVRLITHLLDVRRPCCLLHDVRVLVRRRHWLWHALRPRPRRLRGSLCGECSRLLHECCRLLHLLRRHRLLRKGAGLGICLLLCLGANGGSATAGALDLLHAFGIEAYGHHGAVAHIVLDGNRATGVLQVFLHHGETGSGAADISFHAAVCAGHAKVESAFLVVDSRPLIGKSDGVAPV